MEITGVIKEVLPLAAAVTLEELPVAAPAAEQAEVKPAPEPEAETTPKEEAPPPSEKNHETPFAAVPISQIAKGKRTKRQRVQSPIAAGPAASANSSVGDEDFKDAADDDEDYNYEDEDVVDDDEIMMVENSRSSFLPPTVAGNTKEEEDVANCLILLARGHSVISNNNITIISSPNAVGVGGGKFTSRKFMETLPVGGNGGGKAGYYVYECRTCSRTFPSFQALGGHRASHKKPKNINTYNNNQAMINSNNRFMAMNMFSDEEDNHLNNLAEMNSSLNLQLSSNNRSAHCDNNNNSNNAHNASSMYGNHHKGNSSSKVHECGICGAEFNSGQALGGHMRRHRAPVGAPSAAAAAVASAAATVATTTNLSLVTACNGHSGNGNNSRGNNNHHHNYNKNNVGEATTMLTADHQRQVAGKRGRDGSSLSMSLDLDLNLPAPEEKQPQLQSAFTSKQQPPQKKPTLVFPSPALVGCHY